MTHRAVIRDNAESTKLRVVYDCPARAASGKPSLNDCLNSGPILQHKLWDVLVREWLHPIALVGDLRKAFRQVRAEEENRGALDFIGYETSVQRKSRPSDLLG